MTRLGATFERLRADGRSGLVAYVTAGDPDADGSLSVLQALARAGADVIEVGVPFSDPIADGPVIQRASERALVAGGGLQPALALVRALRQTSDVPVVLFTYVNPVLRLGWPAFVRAAAESGVDGVLLLDLPIEESAGVQAALTAGGLDQIFLVSPTTTDARLAEAGRLARGFVYAISRLGVTGARATLSASAAPLVARIRQATRVPVALGFGISTPEQVAEVGGYADAAVVGSALVDVVARAHAAGTPPAEAVEAFVRWLKGG